MAEWEEKSKLEFRQKDPRLNTKDDDRETVRECESKKVLVRASDGGIMWGCHIVPIVAWLIKILTCTRLHSESSSDGS